MSPLLILALFLPLQDKAPEKCSLSGTVVDFVTGEPLGKVELRLQPLDVQATHVAVTTSDSQGRFAMVDLDPASYALSGKRNGYLEMSFGARRLHGDGSAIRLEPGEALGGLKLKLVPSAVIAGTVRDSDGDPLEGAHVILARFTYQYGARRLEGYDTTESDDRGEYRFRGLEAGKYYIGVQKENPGRSQVDHSANASPTETSVPTLYPGVTDVALATPVEVSAGRNLTGIDIRQLRSRVFRIGGRVSNGPAVGQQTIVLHDQKNAAMRNYDLRTSTKDAAGNFDFRGVPPGAYEVTVGTESLRGRVAVDVGASDVEGVGVTLAPGAGVKLRIVAEGSGETNLTGLNFLLTADGRSGFGSSPFESDRLTARNVPPDHYALRLSGGLLRKSYVKSARAGDADILADGLSVTGPGTIGIEVTVASDGGAIEGVVRDEKQQPVSGATILLAPDRRTRADLFQSVTSDQNGHYEVAAIAPGHYKVFAWEDVETGVWNDPDFLKDFEKQGQATAVEAGARVTANLHLTTRPDVQ